MPDQSPPDRRSTYPDGIGTGQPAWVAFDRQVSVHVHVEYTCVAILTIELCN